MTNEFVDRYLEPGTEAETLAFAQHYWPWLEGFEQCLDVSGFVFRKEDDGEGGQVVAGKWWASLHICGDRGVIPDKNAEPVGTTEDGEPIYPPVYLADGVTPAVHANIRFHGSLEDLLSIATQELQDAVINPTTPHTKFS